MVNEKSILMRPLDRERQGLLDLISRLGSNLIVAEIGSYLGESAKLFLDSGKVKCLYCIDPWINDYDRSDEASYRCPMSDIERLFDERMKPYSNVEKVKATSKEAVNRFRDAFFDLVYVDGMHTYEAVKQDLTLYCPKIRKGGYLAGHDWGWKG